MANPWQYTKAVVRGVSQRLAEAALREKESGEPVDLTKAREQWANYVATLKKLGLQVTEIPASNDFPDCVFIEDTAVVCGTTALITRPGHHTRQGEVTEVKATLEKMGLSTIQMVEPACLDGGDVMFTGKEFFVGMTSRTNKEGLETLQKVFSNYPVSPICVVEGLHLKSMMSMAGPNLIAIGQSSAGEKAWKEIEENGTYKYDKLPLPEDIAANCLYVNGILVHASSSYVPLSIAKLRSLNCDRIELNLSELSKLDGCLTCCSLLIP